MDSCDTFPGFHLQSPNFVVTFEAGFRKGVVSLKLEYETDWKQLMMNILNTLEMCPTSVMTTKNILERCFQNVNFQDIKANVTLEEKIYFPPPLGSEKSLRISFTDVSKTDVVFHMKKKTTMKSLKDLGAAAVVENLKTVEDIGKLEIPTTLAANLVKLFENDWSPKFYRNNLDCCKEHRDGIRKSNSLPTDKCYTC